MTAFPTGTAEAGSTGRWSWVDLRLVPVAGGIWALDMVAPYLAPTALGGVAALAAGLAGVASRRRGRPAVVVALLTGLAVAGALAAVRGAAREGSPLRSAAEEGRTVLVTLELDGDPHVLPGVRASRMVADATVTRLSDGTARHRLRAAVLLFAPADGWRDVRPGQLVRVRAGTAVPRSGDDVVAVLAARGPPTPVGQPGRLARAAVALRDGLAASAARVLDRRAAGLLPGLVVGDTRRMDPVLVEDFRRAGLSHLTAVSGVSVN